MKLPPNSSADVMMLGPSVYLGVALGAEIAAGRLEAAGIAKVHPEER
jgi:hypothetical protein